MHARSSRTRSAALSLVTALALAVSACGPASNRGGSGGNGGGGGGGHLDGGPGEPGPDMAVDPNVDLDGDGFTPGMGDCNDRDPSVYPGAPELCDHKDHNCNGVVDDLCDDDKDGYVALPAGGNGLPGGDCNDNDPLVNPGAMEVYGNAVDDNCNGQTDEVPPACDHNESRDPNDLAGALEICDPWLLSASVNGDSDARARLIAPHFGLYRPHAGRSFLILSTGIAGDASENGFVLPQPGTQFMNDDPNPLPMMNQNGCWMGADEMTVHDYVELTLKIKVPTNARSFSFDFMFVSAEYPEFVCTQYNDKFLAILDSKAYQGNVSFDAKGHPVTVNVGFFDVCQSTMNNTCTKPISKLQGTGYERFDYMNRPIGGGTDWLHTTSPITPGETATLRFILFDEGDHKFDSTVILDNFQFQLEAAMAPMTVG